MGSTAFEVAAKFLVTTTEARATRRLPRSEVIFLTFNEHYITCTYLTDFIETTYEIFIVKKINGTLCKNKFLNNYSNISFNYLTFSLFKLENVRKTAVSRVS